MVSLRPLRHAGFRRLAASYTLNELGWGFGTVALGLLVFDRTHSALATTALWLCTLLVPRSPWIPLVLLLAALDGTLALVGRALTRAAVAATLKPVSDLEPGNALLNVSFSVCFAAGPALGGLAVAAGGVSAALWVSAGLFAAMTVALATSHALPPAHAEVGEGWLARLRAGLGHALGNRAVRRVLGSHASIFICAAMISPVEVIWANDVLDGGDGAYGLVLSAWGAGTLTTGLLLSSIWRRASVLARLPLAAGVMAVGYVVMALATSLPLGAVGCFIGGMGNGFYYVSVVQAIQDRVDDAFQGRVMGLLESTTAGCYGIGFFVAAALTELTSVRVTFAATAGGVIVATLWMATLLRGDARAAALSGDGERPRSPSATTAT